MRTAGCNILAEKQQEVTNVAIGTSAEGVHLPAQAQSAGFQLTATAAAALLDVSTADCTACSPNRPSRGWSAACVSPAGPLHDG